MLEGCRDAQPCVSKGNTDPHNLQSMGLPKSISSFVAGLKSIVIIRARAINGQFSWQPRYYDHIIQNQEEYDRAMHYIKNNVVQWEKDKQ